jgi:hypothetical protein
MLQCAVYVDFYYINVYMIEICYVELLFTFYIIVIFDDTVLLLQEEGWLMGVKEGSGEKGMFPANFTRPL